MEAAAGDAGPPVQSKIVKGRSRKAVVTRLLILPF